MATCADCAAREHQTGERAVDNSAWDGPAAMSRCANSDTPASCYGSICAGRKAGDPALQSSWALPHHKTAGGPPNAAGVRNSLSRLPQTQGLTDAAAARRHLEAHLTSINAGSNSAEVVVEERAFPFELVRADASDGGGLTFEGYAAVFNRPTRISSWEGDFDEVIRSGAFTRTLAERTPKLMFEHGRHPLVGQMPLGVIQETREDTKGLFIRARLTDNWLIQPVRDAVRDGAVDGMSFRFSVPEGGDRVTKRKDDVPLRSLLDLDVPELGPVVFPAYEPTTASVRSLAERLEDFTGRGDQRMAPGGDLADPSGHDETAVQEALHARDRTWHLRRPLHHAR
jgi:HK97 family phage prohead protease